MTQSIMPVLRGCVGVLVFVLKGCVVLIGCVFVLKGCVYGCVGGGVLGGCLCVNRVRVFV